MPALHDMACSSCGFLWIDAHLTIERKRCPECKKGRFEILWQTNQQRNAAVHSSERAALLYSTKERKWQYPATNNQPIPDRLKRRGYERVELPSLHALEQHEKQTGTRSEKAWFDPGTGRGFDD